MISVIICSIDPQRFAAVKSVYTAALGQEPWELIGIHDAKSLADGYTRGIAASKGENLILSHDDIEILSPDFSGRLKCHLEKYDLIGVAGTSRLAAPDWGSSGPPFTFGQVAHFNENGTISVNIFGTPRRAVGGIQAMDGLFLAVRRSVFSTVMFDAQEFDGFHLYDLDFTYAAYRAGCKLAVVNDINLLHASHGSYSEAWIRYAERFERKWLEGVERPTRRFNLSVVNVPTRAEAAERMVPPYWDSP
jgi:GT2 family glycosyltransferase